MMVKVQTQNAGDFSVRVPDYDNSQSAIVEAIRKSLTRRTQGASYTRISNDGSGWKYNVMNRHDGVIKSGQLWFTV